MKLFCFLLLLSIASACSIPSSNTVSFSYIDIEEMNIASGKSDFRDAWLFIDGMANGVYELPRSIPLVTEGPISATIQAGIRQNGVASAPSVYPFVDNYEIDIDLEDGASLELSPVFNYLPNVRVRLDADFEGSNFFGFDEDGNDSTKILVMDGIGMIKLEGGTQLEEATALVYNELPINGSPIYLEIEYRGNLDLRVGLIGITGGEAFKEYFVSLRSENEWKKTYINFTDLVVASKLDGYQILLGVDNQENSSEGLVYVDNIKLLHF